MARVWRSCSAIVFIAACAGNTPATPCFDDENLNKLEHSGNAALVYVWSPRMVLSALHASEARASAQAQGLSWVPVVDARLSANELAQALHTLQLQHPGAANALANSQPLCSATLEQREAYRHFPSAFVLGAGADSRPIVGAMPAVFWQRSIAQRLAHKDAP
jgi:hypothetical protein